VCTELIDVCTIRGTERDRVGTPARERIDPGDTPVAEDIGGGTRRQPVLPFPERKIVNKICDNAMGRVEVS
jgi:hypothetical protein